MCVCDICISAHHCMLVPEGFWTLTWPKAQKIPRKESWDMQGSAWQGNERQKKITCVGEPTQNALLCHTWTLVVLLSILLYTSILCSSMFYIWSICIYRCYSRIPQGHGNQSDSTLPLAVPQGSPSDHFHGQRDGPMSFGHGRLWRILMVCLTIRQNTAHKNKVNKSKINSWT